jgi:protein phosphatase
MALAWGCATDVGKLRPHNEDAVLAAPPVFVVADGMGGHAAGEVASSIVVETFESLRGRTIVSDDIARALTAANTSILELASQDQAKAGMGTTAVGLAVVEEDGATYWLAFNLGDSRLYQFHLGVLTQVSIDHSWVQELVSLGRITADEARTHPERNVVTRVLGSGFPSSADFWLFPAEAGQRFLLCSDGLSNEIEDDEIGAILAVPQPPEVVADLLVRAAMDAGGRDNITVVVVDVLDANVPPDDPDDTQTDADADPGDPVDPSAVADTVPLPEIPTPPQTPPQTQP